MKYGKFSVNPSIVNLGLCTLNGIGFSLIGGCIGIGIGYK